MANFAGNYGWPFVAAANYTGIVKNAQGGAIAFLPTVSGTMTLYDALDATSQSAFLTAFPVTAGQPVILAMAFSRGLYAVLTTAAGTFIMS